MRLVIEHASATVSQTEYAVNKNRHAEITRRTGLAPIREGPAADGLAALDERSKRVA